MTPRQMYVFNEYHTYPVQGNKTLSRKIRNKVRMALSLENACLNLRHSVDNEHQHAPPRARALQPVSRRALFLFAQVCEDSCIPSCTRVDYNND